MKRGVTLIAQSVDRRISIYLDNVNAKSILEYLNASKKHLKRFEFLKGVILNRLKNDGYKWEPILEEEIRDVFAMRFDLHKENGRIYCKQINKTENVKIVIASELHYSKKTEKNGPKELELIKKVHSYEFDIQAD